MKILLVSLLTVFLNYSCVFIRMDDSIDLGSKYRYIQDYPQAILYHKSHKYNGGGINVVPPVVTTYKFNDRYIIVKTKDMEDNQIKYWIVDKTADGAPVEPLDSASFYQQLNELKIELTL